MEKLYTVNKTVQNAVLGCNLKKWQNDLCSFPRQPFNITVIQVYAPTSNPEEAEVEGFCEDLQDLLELTPKKDILFIIGDWNKSRKSRDTWNIRPIWPWSTERSRSKDKRGLPRKCTGHTKHPFPTNKRRLYTWTSPDDQNQNQIILDFFQIY